MANTHIVLYLSDNFDDIFYKGNGIIQSFKKSYRFQDVCEQCRLQSESEFSTD
jgi:hypothetical protein